jgi:aminoglycoside phosphotransferase (APT) family kinase protein
MSNATSPTRTYSEALGAISNAQLQAALDRFDLGTLAGAEPAQTGLFGRNIFLSTTAGEFVLRGAPWDPRLYGKEAFFSRLIAERTGVPAPWPYQIELSPDIFGWPYAIMPRLPGIDVGNPDVRKTLTRDDRIGLARAMGETLARLQALTWPHYGDYDLDSGAIVPADASFAEWTIARVRDQLARCREASAATTDADVAWIESIISSAQEALTIEPEHPTFVFRDYKENNTVAERTTDGWRITGVFDLGESYFGDGEADFSRTLASYLREDTQLVRAFVDGYLTKRTLRPGFEQRFVLYMALDRMIIWEYGQRNNLWFQEGTTLQDWAEPFTSFPIREFLP